ncbi:MAG: GNAT family N-acetyltransferase [Pseudomonadota bacterium]
MTFDWQPILAGRTMSLRGLEAGDFDGLYAAASDPEIWAGHPAKNRYKPDIFEGYFESLIKSGGTLVAREIATNEIIGCSRYYKAHDRPGPIAIGYTFLIRKHWGGTSNYEMKNIMLKHAFKTYDEIWFHIDPANIRSQKATLKIGAEFIETVVRNLSGKQLSWHCYKLNRDRWMELYPK